MKSANKKKAVEVKRAPVSRRKAIPQVQMPDAMDDVFEYWKEEVAGLQAEHFADETAMIDAVVTRVLGRLNTPAHLAEPTRAFLTDLFATDPGLREELRQLLKVG